MRKLIWIIALLLAMSGMAQAQTFSARVNRSTLPEGETFLLTLDLAGAASSSTPDLAGLDNDFTIYSVSNAYRTNIVNGTMEQSRQWNLVLMPKNVGNLTIPSVKLDKYTSNPVTIKVVKSGEQINVAANNTTGEAAQPRFKLEGAVNNTHPYVQQQINYTLTLTDLGGGLQGEEPIFMSSGNDWIIRNLGSPQITTKTINGHNVREIKFNYALFPQKSGELMVPEVKFNGFYLTKDSRRDPFSEIFGEDMFIGGFGMTDVFATRNPVVLSTKPIKLNVRPAVMSEQGRWWLPASKVELFAQFEPANPLFKAGEAVSRTIYLKASGVVDTQLPEISFPEVDGIKQYPEKPLTEMKVENGQVISLEKVVNIYIPASAGKITLPEISVDWFNVKTNRTEKATLPAMTVKVRPGVNTLPGTEPQPTPVTPTVQNTPNSTAPDLTTPESQPVEVLNSVKSSSIYLLLGLAFAAGILVSWIMMRSLNRKKEAKIHNYKKYVLEKAENKDIRGLRDALLGWASEHYQRSHVTSLKEVEELANSPEFAAELEKLTEALYARSNNIWNAESFIKAFNKVNSKKSRKKNDQTPLPKLYKD